MINDMKKAIEDDLRLHMVLYVNEALLEYQLDRIELEYP